MPTFKEVQEKIEARYAKAKAHSELSETSVERSILEIEQATANVEAQSRLSELRAELGLDAAPARRAHRRRSSSRSPQRAEPSPER